MNIDAEKLVELKTKIEIICDTWRDSKDPLAVVGMGAAIKAELSRFENATAGEVNELKGKVLTNLKDPAQASEFIRRLNEFTKHMDCPHWNGEVCDLPTPAPVPARVERTDGLREELINCVEKNTCWKLPIDEYEHGKNMMCDAINRILSRHPASAGESADKRDGGEEKK